MSRIVFMVGPSGSGKSTYALRREERGHVRLTFDVVMWGTRDLDCAAASGSQR